MQLEPKRREKRGNKYRKADATEISKIIPSTSQKSFENIELIINFSRFCK